MNTQSQTRGIISQPILWAVLCCCAILTAPNISWGQLNDEMRELLNEIKMEYDSDIRNKIDAAIANNTDKITFSTDEFDRFRKNPVNPFEGLEDIDLASLNGSIQLKFEVPTVRNRRIGAWERQSNAMLAELSPLISPQKSCIVEIMLGDRRICLGTVIDNRGTIITKASELQGLSDLKIRDCMGGRCSVEVSKVDERNDLALLQSNATHLPPILWSDRQPGVGEFLISGGSTGQAIALGTFSHLPRSLDESDKGFLGVTPRNANGGVELTEVTPEGAADKAGLKAGDVIVSMNATPIVDVSSLVTRIKSHRAGDQVKISFRRNGVDLQTEATLDGWNRSANEASRFKMMNRLGAIPSKRANDLPWVFQHDSPIFPEDCGGPVFDLEGNAIGLNIARQGRVASLGLPTRHLKTIISELQRENIASRNDD